MEKRTVLVLVIVIVLVSVGLLYTLSGKGQAPQTPLSSSLVQGKVLNDAGQPVAGATVYADSINFEGGRMPSTRTDAQGRFRFNNLKNGLYRIYAEKEEDGYASPVSAFHSGDAGGISLVNVYEQQATADTTIFLRPKSARITGQIVNLLTRKAIKGAQIILRRVDNPDYSYSTAADANGRINILVPSEPFTIEVLAEGYKKWRYKSADAVNATDALALTPASTKNLSIALQPIK